VCWRWGSSGTLLKEQGYYSLVQNWGHRGPVLRPRCIGPGGGPYPIYHSILPLTITCMETEYGGQDTG